MKAELQVFQSFYLVNMLLYNSKKDINVVIRLHAQVWPHVDVSWSKDQHYDCLLTQYNLSLAIH